MRNQPRTFMNGIYLVTVTTIIINLLFLIIFCLVKDRKYIINKFILITLFVFVAYKTNFLNCYAFLNIFMDNKVLELNV